MSQLIDVSHAIEDGTVTYVDAPFHRYEDGKDLAELPERAFRFHAAPVKVRAFGTFPVRAYAVIAN